MESIKHKESLDCRDKQEQVINLIKREFQNEIIKRQEEVHLIQKRLLKAKKSLHLLKYVVIKSFYDSKDLKLANKDEFLIQSKASAEKQTTEQQNRIHPAVKKLLGKKPIDFNLPLMRYREKPQTNQPIEIIEEQDIKVESNIDLPVNTNQLEATQISIKNEENIPRGNQKKTKHEIIIGNETLLNVWLYNNADISEDEDLHSIKRIKQEVIDNYETETTINNKQSNTVHDFYSKPSCSKTFHEAETNFQENEINIIHTESGLQVIKKEPTNDIEYVSHSKSDTKIGIIFEDDSDDPDSDDDMNSRDPNVIYDEDRIFLYDHCYTDEIIHDNFLRSVQKYAIHVPLQRFNSTRQIVYFLFKSLPLITNMAQSLRYTCCYPYVAESLEEFASWNIGKQRSSEWYRAKEIKELLILHNVPDQKLWSIKFILMFGRAYAFTPFANYKIFHTKESVKTIPNQDSDLKVTSTFTEFIPVSQLMENKKAHKNSNVDNCIVDVENINYEESDEEPVNRTTNKSVSSETVIKLNPLCTYIKQCAEEIGIKLEDEEIVPNILHNSAERVILKAVMCLAEELIRSAWANKVISNKGRNLDHAIERNDIYRVLLERDEFDIFTNDGLGKNMNV